MNRIYITVVPLQGKTGLSRLAYRRDWKDTAPVETCFPIVQVIADTANEGDELELIAIRQKNADTERNFGLLKAELAELGLGEIKITELAPEENQDTATLMRLCETIIDAIPQVGIVYSCITYGTKTIPVILMSALQCAARIKKEIETGGIYYGEVIRDDGKVVSSKLYNVAALLGLSEMLSYAQDREAASSLLHQLVRLSQRGEG